MAANPKNHIKKDVIGAELRRVISGLKRGSKIIQGSLGVREGHEYWWFLEYGTGEHYTTPPDKLLKKPSSLTKGPGGGYEIEADEDTMLVYLTSEGARHRRDVTYHPGIAPIGFVRSALGNFEVYLGDELNKLTVKAVRTKRLPTREQLVNLVNYLLEVLLGELYFTTPDDRDPDPYHELDRPRTPTLAESWFIVKAKK